MRGILQLNKNRRAVSLIVSYVLLISITLSLSILVYNWLRYYVSPNEVPECSENVKLIIKDYTCFSSTEDPGRLKLTVKNKGLFNISGFRVMAHDREGAEFGIYTFDEEGVPLAPGEEYNKTYSFDGEYNGLSSGTILEKITIVEVQPFVMEGGEIFCNSHAFQRVVC